MPALRNLLGGALCDDPAAVVAAFWAQVDHPIGGLDHVQLVLDHQHRVACVHQPVQAVQQALNIGQMQPGGRLVEDIEVAPAAFDLAQLVGQLDPLCLATRDGAG